MPRGEGNRVENFSIKGDNWLLEVNGLDSIMARGTNSSFTTFCEKRVSQEISIAMAQMAFLYRFRFVQEK